MKRLILSFFLLAMLVPDSLFSQKKADLKNSFYDAESWILFEAYKDALPLYLQLTAQYPDNANYKYRIGQCYMYTPGEKTRAVPYLEDAVKNINPEYKEGKFKETGAPWDALYYMANAYRISNQLDKALETYAEFKKHLDPLLYDSNIVNFQMQACLNAKVLMEKPKAVKLKNIGDIINEGNSEYNPVVSDDESMIVFNRSEAFYDAIMYSVKEDGQWSEPRNMNEILQVDRDLFPTSLSADGKTLFLYSSADYDGIIYSSTYENGTWTPPVKLNDNINTKYWESHATISHDNSTLYFTSNRKGTYGGLDIWKSERDALGDWGPAENLGSVINTSFNEETPFLSRDDRTLYFSSRGHFNMGGYDIFYSSLLDDGRWSDPVNIGYPINSTDDDIFYKPSVSYYRGFYALYAPDGNGRRDIYQIELVPGSPRQFVVTGISTVDGLAPSSADSIRLTITDLNKPGEIMVIYTDPVSHRYSIKLPEGDYSIEYEGYGGEKNKKEISIPPTYPKDSFVVPGNILTRSDFAAQLFLEGNRNISVKRGDSLLFRLTVEPLSQLTIEKWAGDAMISFEKHQVTSPAFSYKMAPEKGDNRIVFKLLDRFNNPASEEVFITRAGGTPHPAAPATPAVPSGSQVSAVAPVSTVSPVSPAPKIARPERQDVIARKQALTYIALLENRAEGNMQDLIRESGVKKRNFTAIDDVNKYLDEKGSARNITQDETGKLAFRVAVMDNVLSQAAAGYLYRFSDGETRQALEGINVNMAGLKTWSDLQNYIAGKTRGRISQDEVSELAAVVLGGTDRAITVMREKIALFAEQYPEGMKLKNALEAADKAGLKLRGPWLKYFCEQALSQGITGERLAGILGMISSLPDATTDQYLEKLTGESEEPLYSALLSSDLKTEKVKSAGEVLSMLMSEGNSGKYPPDLVYKAVASLIVSADIQADLIRARSLHEKAGGRWMLPVILVAVAAVIILVMVGRKKNKKQS